MKRILLIIMLFSSISYANAQAYIPLNIQESENVTIKSKEGIVVQGTIVNKDKSITVTFMNSNYNNSGERNTYTFDWYLSYRGKRVSDYYSEAIRCRKTDSRTVYFWPNSVPAGHEKYVTVQLGREPRKKDRRDDY